MSLQWNVALTLISQEPTSLYFHHYSLHKKSPSEYSNVTMNLGTYFSLLFLTTTPPVRYMTNYNSEEWVTTVGWVGSTLSWTSRILIPHLPASKNHCSGRKGSLVLHTPVSLVPSYRCPSLYIIVRPYIFLTMVVPAEWACQKNYFKTYNLFLLVLVTCIYHQRSFSQNSLPGCLSFKILNYSSLNMDLTLSSFF